jgi:hypothetical protein
MDGARGKQKENGYFRDLRVDGEIILSCALQKQSGLDSAGSELGPVALHLKTQERALQIGNIQEIS